MHPRLEEIAAELEKTRWAASLCDPEWRLVWASTELKVLVGETDEEKLGYGKNLLETWMSEVWNSTITIESQISSFLRFAPYLVARTPGGPERVEEILAEFGISMEGVKPEEPPLVLVNEVDYIQEGFEPSTVRAVIVQLYQEDGEYLGSMHLYGSALPARILALVARGDEAMYERMANLVRPGRRQAAVLFADLQESGVLSKRLPSAAYFKLVAAITGAMDKVIIEQKGIVGKHVGDGATAFFLAEDLGSPSRAARAAVEAAREISEAAARAAKRAGEETGLIEGADCIVNVGVHWGGTLYMGQLVTGGRLEVTALGDAVNECARIQESARDGEALATKTLLEHLTDEDAAALGLDPDAVVYRTVADLPGATTKAKRDAGTLPVTTL